ncbi:hypothetical protein RhiLY_02645 [Ceratobasidium sp. AG-Ba]|nr:hypothetical protein RhiLY_02645 [Ceratobasidium sp. AG-Ba]
MHRLFQVPDLLDLTLEQIPQTQIVSALYVSRAFFASAAPVLWGRLYRTSDLLLLVSGARLAYTKRIVQMVELPSLLDESHFTRFNIYAKLVKTIAVDSRSKSPFPKHRVMIPALRLDGILNWQVLLDHLGGRPLLPNLGTILQNSDSTVCLKWLRILLAPSVHSLTTSHDHERPLEMVFEILGIARQRCPNLRSLTISARGFEADDVKEDPDPASLQHRLLQLVSSFVAFQRLTYLRSNGSILYPQAFLVLSELPCLERVAVEVGKMPQLVYDHTTRYGFFVPPRTRSRKCFKLFLDHGLLVSSCA